MVSINNYRLLQAYGGLMDASGSQVIADANEVQLGTMDASFGPTAYNTTLAADFDDITVTNSGIYEIVFETNSHNGEEGTTLYKVRSGGTVITGMQCLVANSATAADFSMFKTVAIRGYASLAAGAVIDVSVTCSSACTLTLNNTRLTVRRVSATF